MDDEAILGHLLKIETEASALVNDAQAEADRRTAEGEKRNRAAYEERYSSEAKKLEAELQTEKVTIKKRYERELAAYEEKLSSIKVDVHRFSALLENLVAGEY